jgi:hypothetical protein
MLSMETFETIHPGAEHLISEQLNPYNSKAAGFYKRKGLALLGQLDNSQLQKKRALACAVIQPSILLYINLRGCIKLSLYRL